MFFFTRRQIRHFCVCISTKHYFDRFCKRCEKNLIFEHKRARKREFKKFRLNINFNIQNIFDEFSNFIFKYIFFKSILTIKNQYISIIFYCDLNVFDYIFINQIFA